MFAFHMAQTVSVLASFPVVAAQFVPLHVYNNVMCAFHNAVHVVCVGCIVMLLLLCIQCQAFHFQQDLHLVSVLCMILSFVHVS